MSEAGKIKFAVVGFGHIGKRHAAIINGHQQTELVAIAEADPAAYAEAKKLYSIAVFESMDDLLNAGLEIDVISICTPNGLHAEQAAKALDHRCHVVLEKPMGLSKRRCEEIIFKSLQASRNVFCVKQNRYSPASLWLKSLIDENRLGEICLVQLNCYWNRDAGYYKKGSWKGTKEMDGGVLFTQFSHFIDIMYWLFGDIDNIMARFINFNHKGITDFDDTGIVSFDLVQGGIGSINFSTSAYGQNMESSMTILGATGSVKVSGQYMDQVTYCNIKDYKMPELPPPNPPNDYGKYKGSAANHHYVIQNVIDVLAGKSVISTNALEGMKVVEIIERIYEAGK